MLRIAVHGILAENAGSGAGSFLLLLRGLLERGHRVEFFANPGYVQPRSLEPYGGYRFRPLRSESAERFYAVTRPFGTYASAVSSQFSHLAYDREAKRAIDELDRSEPYDFVLCTDAQAFWPSRLPVVSWPQSPPQTEAAALRDPTTRRYFVRSRGAAYYGAVQGFYAYRWALSRAALASTDVFLCASRWAADEWVRFGVARERVRLLPYPFELGAFSEGPPVGTHEQPTLLWLGRAAPRKRLDLFLAAFADVRRRRPNVRARLVGNLKDDAFAAPLLAEYASLPGLSIEDPLPRERIPSLLAEVDVVVQPSQNENFGFALAEALAAGRPIVAGPTNGTLEFAGRAGFGFDAYTKDSVASAIERALDAVGTRGGELSASAREAAKPFSTERVVDEFCRLGAEIGAARRKT
jgi:glycosyltransferase involved in cell wall biosynthesis